MAVFDKFSGINLVSGFKLQKEAPLDGRLVVDTKAELTELVEGHGAYVGMLVYCKADNILYQLESYSYGVDDEATASWVPVGGSLIQEMPEEAVQNLFK